MNRHKMREIVADENNYDISGHCRNVAMCSTSRQQDRERPLLNCRESYEYFIIKIIMKFAGTINRSHGRKNLNNNNNNNNNNNCLCLLIGILFNKIIRIFWSWLDSYRPAQNGRKHLHISSTDATTELSASITIRRNIVWKSTDHPSLMNGFGYSLWRWTNTRLNRACSEMNL